MITSKYRLNILGFLMLYSLQVKSQSSFGFRFTPNITNQPKVENSSPTRLYGENRISFNAGLDFTHMFKDKPYGLRYGLGVGVVDYNYAFEAPRKAFGTMQGDGNIYEINNFENYTYANLSIAYVRHFKIRNLIIESYLGVSRKFYQYAKEEDGYALAINRSTPYNFNDPNAGPPDLLVTFPPINGRLHIDIPFGIGIVRKYSDKSSFSMSFVKNWNIQPIAKGDLFVQAYGNSYIGGEFSPRSSFVGLDLRYNYTLDKKKNEKVLSRNIPEIDEKKSSYAKAVFIELLGAGGIGSINVDTRLMKNQQYGFGLRVGFGVGEYFSSDLSANSGRYHSLPLGINYLIGKRRNSLELGAIINPQFTFRKVLDGPQVAPLGFINFGYRFQPLKEGLLFRAGWQPFYGTRGGFSPTFVGASIGYGFK
jgi:hypothetical protein